MADRELIEALRKGRNEAWTELVDKYLKLVYHVVRRTLATYMRQVVDPDVEDITNDLFQSLVAENYRVLGTIGPPYELKAWLAISAKRRAIDFARKRKLAAVSLDEGKDEDLGMGALVAAKPEAESRPNAEAKAAIAEAMQELNSRERMIVQLFYLKGKKYREIARIAGINQNSISPTLARAVEKMQKSMKDRNLLT